MSVLELFPIIPRGSVSVLDFVGLTGLDETKPDEDDAEKKFFPKSP
jgi:hypothetical protein